MGQGPAPIFRIWGNLLRSYFLKEFWGKPTIRNELRKTLYMAIAGVVLGLIGPFDSYNLPQAFARHLYWLSLILISSLMSGPIARVLFPRMIGAGYGPLPGFAAFTVAMSVGIFPFVIFNEIYLSSPYGVTLGYSLEFLSHVGAWDYAEWFGQVLVLTAVLLGAISMIHQAMRPAAAPPQAPTSPPPPTLQTGGEHFLKRLAPNLGQELLHLSMEDHYLRAFTTKGDQLILMRLRDAASELQGYPGLQVHRSHWVAFEAISEAKRDGRRAILTLKNGHEIPVSRSYMNALKEHGVL